MLVIKPVNIVLRRWCSNTSKNILGKKKSWVNNHDLIDKFTAKYKLERNELVAAKKDLTTDFSTLQTEAEIFEEAGISVTVKNLKRFRKIFEDDLRSLLTRRIITDINIGLKFTTVLEKFPYDPGLPLPSTKEIEDVYKKIKQYQRRSLHAKEIIREWPQNVEEEKTRSLETEQRRVLRQYFAWRLNADYYTIDKLMYNYSKITGLRSIGSIKRTFDILEHDVKYSPDQILRNFFLLSVVPERLNDVISNVEKVGASDLLTVAHEVPKILAKTSAQIKEIDSILREYGIPDSATCFRNQVFTFAPATIRFRLEKLSKSNLSTFIEHPRICQMIYYFTKAWTRSKELEKLGIKCPSLNILTSNEKCYNSYLGDGVDRRHVMRDLQYFISNRLDVPNNNFSKSLMRHPMRWFVPMTEVKATLEALLELGFSKEVILETISIVLYSKEKVLQVLNEIKNSQELKDLGYVNGFTPVTNKFTSGSKSEDKRLQLCLYYLEKPYHFTGEGATRINKEEAI